jgi:hypothetical protein
MFSFRVGTRQRDSRRQTASAETHSAAVANTGSAPREPLSRAAAYLVQPGPVPYLPPRRSGISACPTVCSDEAARRGPRSAPERRISGLQAAFPVERSTQRSLVIEAWPGSLFRELAMPRLMQTVPAGRIAPVPQARRRSSGWCARAGARSARVQP